MSYLTGRGHVRLVVALTAIAGLVCGFGTTPAGAAASRARHPGVLVPTKAHEKLPLHGGTADSLNWAGYAVTPGSGITAVDSTFTVPSAGEVPPGFSATWAGIGGYTTSDLIQAGVSEQSPPSNSVLGDQYYAWYEILPAGETQITSGCAGAVTDCAVSPGDHMTVDIYLVSGSTWHIHLADSAKWTYDINLTYDSSRSSAEWILEAPTVEVQTIVANVSTVTFGPTSTYSENGATHTIAQGNPIQIDLSPGLVNEATPSALASDGQSFDVCAYKQSCPAP
jgi:hypothetical protein